MLKYNPRSCLPSSEELPDSDDTPVDNQLQQWIAELLDQILFLYWQLRSDWYFGIDMGIYDDPDRPAICPDAFLSLGVPRDVGEQGRLSYVLWDEGKVPVWVLEIVSQTRRGEYSLKKKRYREMGVLYYAIYAPDRKRKPPLEIYKLVGDSYEVLSGNPVWMEEIGLGLGRDRGTYKGLTREWLYWYDRNGNRLPTPSDRIQKLEQQQQNLITKLQQLGIDPKEIL